MSPFRSTVTNHARPSPVVTVNRVSRALADLRAPDGAHIHLDPGIDPLDLGSASLMIARYLAPRP